MAVLETIRVKFGIVITVLIAVALLSFIIDPSTLQSVSSSMSSKYDVGNIDGKAVSYTDFQTEIDRFTTINELSTGSSAQNEEQQQQIRNAAVKCIADPCQYIRIQSRYFIFAKVVDLCPLHLCPVAKLAFAHFFLF